MCNVMLYAHLENKVIKMLIILINGMYAKKHSEVLNSLNKNSARTPFLKHSASLFHLQPYYLLYIE
jgi:hypothetical protein